MKKLNVILFSLIIASVLCCTSNKNGLTGVINVRGNEPFIYLSIETAEGKILEIDSPDSLQKILWDLQGQKVTLEVQEMKKNMNRDVAVVTSHQLTPWTKKEMEK